MQTVAVIDDDKELVKILKQELTKKGYNVSSAFDGEAGFQLLKKVKPDLVILDISMPKLDGYQVMERINADKELKGTPVILLTGMALEEDIQKGIDLGAVHYMIKPLRTKQLIRSIEISLSNKMQ